MGGMELVVAADGEEFADGATSLRGTRYVAETLAGEPVQVGDARFPLYLVTFTELRQLDGSTSILVSGNAYVTDGRVLRESCSLPQQGVLVHSGEDRFEVDASATIDNNLVSTSACEPLPALQVLPIFSRSFAIEGDGENMTFTTDEGTTVELALFQTSGDYRR